MKTWIPWLLSLGLLALLGGAYLLRPRPGVETRATAAKVLSPEPKFEPEPQKKTAPPAPQRQKTASFDDCLSSDPFLAHRAISQLQPSRETNAFLLDYAHSSRDDEDRIVAIGAIRYDSLNADELPRFLALLNDPSEEIRIAAVNVTPDRKRLTEMLETDPSERVREEIRGILAND